MFGSTKPKKTKPPLSGPISRARSSDGVMKNVVAIQVTVPWPRTTSIVHKRLEHFVAVALGILEIGRRRPRLGHWPQRNAV